MGIEVFVSTQGDNRHPGTKAFPLASLERAIEVVREMPKGKESVTIYLRGGTYYLENTIQLKPEDSGREDAPLSIEAFEQEEVVISGAQVLQLNWKSYKNGIMWAKVPTHFQTDQLVVNGEPLHMARYPNYDQENPVFNGYAHDCISSERVRRWRKPEMGFFHVMHKHLWGGYHYEISGKDEQNQLILKGGWQNNRQMGWHDQYRFVEHIFEELDAPGEWYLDAQAGKLFVYPPEQTDLDSARIEATRLQHLFEIVGTEETPVQHIRIKNITFTHTRRTFMETKEPLLRSDWTIYRGGALFYSGTEYCQLTNCTFKHLGGNAVFVSSYNRYLMLKASQFSHIGANGIAFVGNPTAVRSPLFNYDERQSYEKIDKDPGPKSNQFPSECLVENCLLYKTGLIEKQTAPIQISMSFKISVRHCSIYDVPRAGINISEGTWGGHLIEYCDVFDTVLETGDHGSFNSWGRDRYWELSDVDINNLWQQSIDKYTTLPLLDAIEPTIIRYNRFRCDHGWDIDLDDGSSHYHIYSNLCLQGGIKLREGFLRICENNITVNNAIHVHVWYENSQDIIKGNIMFQPYKPIRMPLDWQKHCGINFLHQGVDSVSQHDMSDGQESLIIGDAQFFAPEQGDYTISRSSSARATGFENFPMNQFGVQIPALKKLARKPQLDQLQKKELAEQATHIRDNNIYQWQGMKIKNIVGMGEVSASGLAGETGVQILEQGTAHGIEFMDGDVILKRDNHLIISVTDLLDCEDKVDKADKKQQTFTIFRNYKEIKLNVNNNGVS
jgi:hypothetical protein